MHACKKRADGSSGTGIDNLLYSTDAELCKSFVDTTTIQPVSRAQADSTNKSVAFGSRFSTLVGVSAFAKCRPRDLISVQKKYTMV